MGSRRTKAALRRRAGIALAVWAIALSLLAVASAVPEGPTAALAVDNAAPAVGTAVHFNASASSGHDQGNGRIVAYRFAFGDGAGTAWQPSPLAAHAYAMVGTFVAAVDVIDQRNLTDRASTAVHVVPAPPPASGLPDLIPVRIDLAPPEPHVDDSVHLTVTVLNRGQGNASSATVDTYDLRPDGSVAFLGSVPLSRTLVPSDTESESFPAFVAVQAGNHTIRAVVANVTPAGPTTRPQELNATLEVLASGEGPGPGGNSAAAIEFGPLAIGLGAAAVAAIAGAGYLLLRRPPKGPMEPPPAQPPDQSPPPIWPQ